MMNIPFYHVDAFTNKLFGGNPAAVCPLVRWLDDATMHAIAIENALPITAFFVPNGEGFRIRWFTKTVEINLCGHATLASAFVLFEVLGYKGETILFETNAGVVTVRRTSMADEAESDVQWFTLDFPADIVQPALMSAEVLACFARQPVEVYEGVRAFMLVYEHENDIAQASANIQAIWKFAPKGVIITAPGTDVDFVSRYFVPSAGVDEDPVTGSAHTSMMPYWSRKLGKTELIARQLSSRGGYLKCALRDDRVLISGQAVLYSTGSLALPQAP